MNGIKTIDWLKCNICFNTYDDSSLRPRSLSCGHTFCEGCLNSTLQNEFLICPQCRKSHEINSVLDLPVNFTLEGILKSLNTCSIDVSEGATQKNVEEESTIDNRSRTVDSLCSLVDHQKKSASAQKEVLKTSSGMCHDHPSMECMFRCSTHMCWVCEQCIKDHEDHPKNKCKITSFKEEIEQRRQEHIESLIDEEEFCDETLSLIQKHILYLIYERERHITLITSLQDLVIIHKKEEENIQNEINSFQKNIEEGKNVKERLLDDKASVLSALTLDESNFSRDMVKKKKAETRNWINSSQKEVLEDKLKIADSASSALSTEKSLEYREDCERLKFNNKTELNCSESNVSQGVECRREFPVVALFYSCLQCRTDECSILCGSCFVNSAHVNHMHEIMSIESGFCDCGISEAWKSNPTCMKHLQIEQLLEPYDADASEYSSSKCKKVFFYGEKCFSCLDCRNSTDETDILCGSCFVNSSHRNHTYEIYNNDGEGAFCDCGRKESWKSEHSCAIHADIDMK